MRVWEMFQKIRSFTARKIAIFMAMWQAAAVVATSGYRITPKAAMQTGALNPSSIVTLMVVGLLAAILIPIAIDQFVSADTTSWSTTTQTIWTNLPLILAVALLLGFIGFFTYSRGRR
jgi:mannose/fructose/N-acetylgalactosamine-specific phosphotransferase system component IID